MTQLEIIENKETGKSQVVAVLAEYATPDPILNREAAEDFCASAVRAGLELVLEVRDGNQ